MTVVELEELLTEQIDRVPQIGDVPPDVEEMIGAIAKWMHIDQEGFAKSDLIHMRLEARVLIDMLRGAYDALGDLAEHAKDTEADGF